MEIVIKKIFKRIILSVFSGIALFGIALYQSNIFYKKPKEKTKALNVIKEKIKTLNSRNKDSPFNEFLEKKWLKQYHKLKLLETPEGKVTPELLMFLENKNNNLALHATRSIMQNIVKRKDVASFVLLLEKLDSVDAFTLNYVKEMIIFAAKKMRLQTILINHWIKIKQTKVKKCFLEIFVRLENGLIEAIPFIMQDLEHKNIKKYVKESIIQIVSNRKLFLLGKVSDEKRNVFLDLILFLLKNVKNKNIEIKKYTIKIFFLLEDAAIEAIPFLIKTLDNKNTKKEAINTIVQIITSAKSSQLDVFSDDRKKILSNAMLFFVKNAQNKNLETRKIAILILSRIGTNSKIVINIFVKALGDKSRFIRLVARNALIKNIKKKELAILLQNNAYSKETNLKLISIYTKNSNFKNISQPNKKNSTVAKETIFAKKIKKVNLKLLFMNTLEKSLLPEDINEGDLKDLEVYGDFNDIEVLVRILKGKNLFLAFYAGKTLSIIGSKATPFLIKLLKNKSAFIRANSIKALGSIFPKTYATVDVLLDIIATDKSGWVKTEALLALEK